MNSWANHIPKAVGAMGAVLLIYSMYTFFRRPDPPAPLPVKAQNVPKPIVPSKTAPAKYQGKSWDTAVSGNVAHERKLKERKERFQREEKERLEANLRVPREYLASVDLKMFIPEEMQFTEAKQERMKILIGLRDNKPELFVASGRQKMTPEQARAELEDQMGAYGLKVSKQDSNSRPSLGQTTVFKGSTGDGGQFLAEYFYNPSTGNGHMVLMMGQELSRQPARTRQIFDSLGYEK